MAIDYPTLFADIGAFITSINQLRDTAVSLNSARPDLPALERATQDALTATTTDPPDPPPVTPRGRFSVLSGVDEAYVGIKDSMVSQADTLAAFITDRLLDETTVVSQLPGFGDGVSLDRVLVELANDMLATGNTVLESTVTIGSPTPVTGNNGNGVVFTSKRLDGATRPGSSFDSSILYGGRNTELVVQSEELLWTCTGDQFDSGTADGGESFQLESRPQPAGGAFTWRTEGSGESLGISTFNSVGTLLVNKDFEDWDDPATPTGWTVESGTVQQEQAAANVFRGASSLQFTGPGKISQPVTGLTPRTMYVATIAYKAAATANLTFKFEGTLASGATYIATGEELVDISIDSDWSQSAIFYLVPDQPMTDGKLTVAVDGQSYIDSMTLGLVQWIGGVGTCIVAGQNPWVTGDRVRVLISNDDAGKFQQLWRKFYQRQLPSSATPTITEPAL